MNPISCIDPCSVRHGGANPVKHLHTLGTYPGSCTFSTRVLHQVLPLPLVFVTEYPGQSLEPCPVPAIAAVICDAMVWCGPFEYLEVHGIVHTAAVSPLLQHQVLDRPPRTDHSLHLLPAHLRRPIVVPSDCRRGRFPAGRST